ncbi:hypothetical protein [Chitinophaga sp.]|uniref:hypothetical protein n=1 Tax=Chitinophaga sp. TaxID=1869181 RepID=UPI0031E3E583
MEKMLKTYDTNSRAFYDSIIVSKKGSNDSVLEYRGNDIFLTGIGDYPFMALADIREQLKKRGLLLLCEGARIDVFPSSMAFTSFLAYKTVIGRPASKEDLVHILNPTDDVDIIGSLEDQEAHRIRWVNSLG